MSAHPGSLSEIAVLFLRLGATSFGGPAAHIAMLREEVVGRRSWLTDTEFLDLVSAANLIPGPNSTEVAIHIGHKRAGLRGLVTAGVCFILPAALAVIALSWFYVRYRQLPVTGSLLYGIKPVIIAIILQALIALASTALKQKQLILVAAVSCAALLYGVNELVVLLIAGLLAIRLTPGRMLAVPITLLPLFLSFLKIGSVLFGSGYVLLAFLKTEFIEHRGWITQSQLLDAVAIGQLTPGPLFTTATSLGYFMAGFPGAIVATIGIFLPAFILVAVTAPIIPKMRNSKTFANCLDAINAASLGLMAAVTLQLTRASITDPLSAAITITSFLAIRRLQINSTWLIAAGAAVGLTKLWLQ
jgi:chromate transporter